MHRPRPPPPAVYDSLHPQTRHAHIRASLPHEYFFAIPATRVWHPVALKHLPRTIANRFTPRCPREVRDCAPSGVDDLQSTHDANDDSWYPRRRLSRVPARPRQVRDLRRVSREPPPHPHASDLTSTPVVQMDLGVGSFVFSQGVVSAIPLIRDPAYLTAPFAPKLQTVLRKTAPVIALGLVRVLLVKSTEYPVCHVFPQLLSR